MSLSSPRLDTPDSVTEAMDMTARVLSPAADDAVTDAQPAASTSIAGPLVSAASLTPSEGGSSPLRVLAHAHERGLDSDPGLNWARSGFPSLEELPNEVLFNIFSFLDISDVLSASRTSHLFHSISCSPILHHYRLRRTRCILPPLLWSPSRPTLADLISRRIFLTRTSIISKRLARSLVSIKLSRRLATRPSPETLVQRAVLPKECVPGLSAVPVAPGLVAKKKAIEKERVKDGLRQWIATKWRGEVRQREEGIRRLEESRGVGRVWKLRKFWERVGRGEALPPRVVVQ